MKNLVKFALLGFTAWLFTACGSSQYAITYATNPSGANVVCAGGKSGFSPFTLYYDMEKVKEGGFLDENGILTTAPCKAVFISGYVDYFTWKWDTKKFPKGVTQTLTRPQGEGYAQDMEFSMQYQMQSQAVAAAQAQAKAAKKAAAAAQQQANQAAFDAVNNSIQQNQQNLQNQQRNFQLQQMNNNLQQMNRTLRGY